MFMISLSVPFCISETLGKGQSKIGTWFSSQKLASNTKLLTWPVPKHLEKTEGFAFQA